MHYKPSFIIFFSFLVLISAIGYVAWNQRKTPLPAASFSSPTTAPATPLPTPSEDDPTNPANASWVAQAEKLLLDTPQAQVANSNQIVPWRVVKSQTDAYVYFHQAPHDGIVVENNEFGVQIFANDPARSHFMYGRYYDLSNVPIQPAVTMEQAKAKLIGKIFTECAFAGPGISWTATSQDIGNGSLAVLVPGYQITTSTLTWKIQVRTSWYVYIDAITGKEVFTENQTVC